MNLLNFSISSLGNSVLLNLNDSKWWSSYAECPLLDIENDTDKIRVITELIQLVGAFLYIVAALREMKFLGYHMFIENLVCDNFGIIFVFSLSKDESQFNASNFRVSDDCTVASDVFVFMLPNDDRHPVAHILFD